MKLAVCLISRDRYEYTKRTVETFHRHNAHLDLIRLHADDCSEDPRVREIGKTFGFEQVNMLKSSRGGQMMRALAIRSAVDAGATHVYILENDIETARPLPMPLLETIAEDSNVYCTRLYGIYKERNNQRKCSSYHLGRGKDKPVVWDDYPNDFENAQIGDVHWGAQPCITNIGEAVWLHTDTRREADIWRKCVGIKAKTVRLLHNVTYHIGEDRTPNFRA